MTEIKTEITIHAPIEKIWKVLTHFDAYPTWNSFIPEIKGKAGLNERLAIKIKPPGKNAMIFKPKIISWKENKEFSWLGGVLIPGIFDGHHCFQLKEISDNQVKVVHMEYFSGILKKLIFKTIVNATRLGFEQMNQALKARCELEP